MTKPAQDGRTRAIYGSRSRRIQVLLGHKLLARLWRGHSCLPGRDSSRPSSLRVEQTPARVPAQQTKSLRHDCFGAFYYPVVWQVDEKTGKPLALCSRISFRTASVSDRSAIFSQPREGAGANPFWHPSSTTGSQSALSQLFVCCACTRAGVCGCAKKRVETSDTSGTDPQSGVRKPEVPAPRL